MNLPIKLLGSLAVAGLVAAGGAAFTATGIAHTAVNANRQIGGEVSQTVDGAVMSSIDYTSDPDTGNVTEVTVTFGAALQAGSTIELDAFSDSGMTTPLANNSNIAKDGSSTGAVYVFKLDSVTPITGEGDAAGTTLLRAIKVTVVGNNV